MFRKGLRLIPVGLKGVYLTKADRQDNPNRAEAFKQEVVKAKEGDTLLTLKELAPVRLLKNKFFDQVMELYKTNPSKEQLTELLGRARAKRGMFEGDLQDGELEIGQVAGLIHQIKPAAEIVSEIIEEFNTLNALRVVI